MIFRFRGREADARIAGDLTTDARIAQDHPQLAERDPDSDRRQRRRRGLAWFALGGVFVVGLVTLLLGHGGVLDARRLSRELAILEDEVREQRSRVSHLEDSVRDLDQGTFPRERIAREQLGFARPGEVTFVFPEKARSGTGADDGS